MAYTVLARKYRSSTFDQVVGQDHVAQTLKRAIESGRVAHAFLFCGTRGTGKTSMARILAKALNCESSEKPTTLPCGTCTTCKAIARGDDIDVIEIDAASNRGIDEVRKIIENARLSPARSRFKIYIIDEVHAMTKDAFNALLKVLEEPPAHVKFILATTEPEKVLTTILSRCQRYDFRNIPTREIAGHLREICKSENIEAQDDAILLVAKAGAGSMRDALSVLDRLLSVGEKELSVEMVEQLLGLPKAQLLFDLCQAIGTGNVKGVLEQSSGMMARGMSADSLVASLVDHLRNLLVLKTCGPDSQLVEVPGIAMKDLVEQAGKFDVVNLTQDVTILEELRRHMRQSQSGRALLDATLVRLSLAEQFTAIADLLDLVGGATGNDEKKNALERPRVSAATTPAAGPSVREIVTTIKAQGEMAQRGYVTPSAVKSDEQTPVAQQPVAEQPTPADGAPAVTIAPVVAPPSSLEFEDDDLPRAGKVWDDSGPSLVEMLRGKTGGASSQSPPVSQPLMYDNVEPVKVEADLSKMWASLLEALKDQPAMLGPLSNATLAGVKDQQAVIKLTSEFFIKSFDRPGRREMLCDHLSRLMGRPLGVKFELGPSAAAEPTAADRPAGRNGSKSTTPPRNESRGPAMPEPAMPEPVATPSLRITPELVEQMRKDPLIAAVMDTLSGTPVKVE